MNDSEPVIVEAVRTTTGRGKPGGARSHEHPVDLLATVLTEVVDRAGIDPGVVDDVIAGCVTQGTEQAANVARSAVLAAGFPQHVPGTTVDRQCGSSQQAIHFAAQGIAARAYDVAIACGVEMMSRVPMFSQYGGLDPYGPRVRQRYAPGLVPQGIAAELLVRDHGFTRAELDSLAVESHRRAAATWESGGFDREVVAGSGPVRDETVRAESHPGGLAKLSPVFTEEGADRRFGGLDWSVTAGNSSPLSDGAAAVLLMSRAAADRLGCRPRAAFRSFAVVGHDPVTMLDAVVPATRAALRRAALTPSDIDSFEVNEAFAVVPLLWQRSLGIGPDRVNPRGGAIALGHPLGASGARLMTTLLHTLEDRDLTFGLQTMCEAGGMANATVIERVSA
ncbi:thiolase family protein [Streptomyces sp. NPDC055078]